MLICQTFGPAPALRLTVRLQGHLATATTESLYSGTCLHTTCHALNPTLTHARNAGINYIACLVNVESGVADGDEDEDDRNKL